VRVVGFNAERGTRFDGIERLLRDTRGEVLLLSEMDHGMARSAQRHVTRELSYRLGHQYAYGIEFVELGLGSASEQERHRGEENAVGHHGGAIASAAALRDPEVVRLETRGYWFDPVRGEPRIGGRIAVLAGIEVRGVEVVVASVHLHSHGGPGERAEEMAVLLDAIDGRCGGGPAVIGGDLNTHTFEAEDLEDVDVLIAGVRARPERLVDPVPHEPLFEVARARGFEWESANPPGTTTCRGPGGTAVRLDWFLVRGVEASAPEVIDAADVSDHDAIAVTITPRVPGARGRGGR